VAGVRVRLNVLVGWPCVGVVEVIPVFSLSRRSRRPPLDQGKACSLYGSFAQALGLGPPLLELARGDAAGGGRPGGVRAESRGR